ncbi:MAG: hypothetical protein AB8H86_16835 [Polyangiales bacterium]
MRRCLTLATAFMVFAGCGSAPADGCVTRTDCESDEVCINGACQSGTPDAATGPDAGIRDGGGDGGDLCGQECETALPCEIGVYDCSEGQPTCVRSGLREEGFVCREASDACDLADQCDGVSAGCADNKSPIGSACNGGFCDGRGACGLCQEGASCNPTGCQAGAISCSDTGVPSCEFTNNLPDETSCGPIVIGGFSACEWPSTCAESGVQSRELQEPLCVAGVCTTVSRFEEMPCGREREGVSCGDPLAGEWSACSFDSMCDESGERSRTVTSRTCASAMCVEVPSEVSEACERDTEGDACGDSTTTFDACVFASECAVGGTQMGTMTTPTCGGGTCDSESVAVSQACSRPDTMGDACGTPTYGEWGTCVFFTCDPAAGTRYRSLTSACTTAQTCDPAGTGFEIGTCTGDVTGSFCNPPGGGIGSCTGPGLCNGTPI